MSKVRITVRLYRMHDLDLITFIETHELSFQKAMYCALTSFAKDEIFVINIPPKREEGEELNLRRYYTMVLTLDSEKDKDAILLLNRIANGKKNNFLKNILRLYLCNPMSENFLVDENDADYFYKKFEIFRSGKRVANLNEKKSGIKFQKSDDKKDKKEVIEQSKNTSNSIELKNEADIKEESDIKKDEVDINTNEESNVVENITEEDSGTLEMFSSIFN